MLVGLSLRPRGLRCCIPILLITLLLLPSAFAQETTAGVQGTVRDATGTVVPNATIEVSGPALLGTRKVQSDDSGAYRVAALPPGTYTLAIAATGFRTAKLA